jgi:hypothetical protein
MSKRPLRVPSQGKPLLDLVSRGHRGPGGTIHFSHEEVQLIARTIRSTPEVVVKVTGGGTQVGGVAAHLAYIGRQGELEIETDEGERCKAETRTRH